MKRESEGKDFKNEKKGGAVWPAKSSGNRGGQIMEFLTWRDPQASEPKQKCRTPEQPEGREGKKLRTPKHRWVS